MILLSSEQKHREPPKYSNTICLLFCPCQPSSLFFSSSSMEVGDGPGQLETRWQFASAVLIPAQTLRQEATLVPVVTALVPPKLASKLIAAVGATCPEPSLRHLKRVRKPADNPAMLELFVCQPLSQSEQGQQEGTAVSYISVSGCEGSEEQSQQACVPAAAAALLEQHCLSSRLTQVPGLPPQTRAQWEAWSAQYWPLTWRVPEGQAELALNGMTATSEEQAYFEHHMSAILDAVPSPGACNCARIVNPAGGLVVGQGLDARHQHPLHHAALVALDHASKRDLILWPPSTVQETADSTVHEHDSLQHQGHNDAQQGREQESGTKRVCTGHQQQEGAAGSWSTEMQQDLSSRAPSAGRMSEAGSIAGDRPYMCTGYDCFLAFEPCIMCAMALVHSRLSRVIYCYKDPQGGALGGQQHLMAKKSLNHHFKVYHLPLRS
jgi:tRNA-specific adenosine deaminase 3